MSKSTFAELLAESKAKIFKPGDMIEGEVFTASGNKIVVDIDGRGLGVIYSKELSADTPKLNKGEKIVATVLETEDEEGNVILSLRRADREKFWEELKKKYDDGDSFKVKVITANKGGLMVETSGVRGFLPVSQLNSEHYPRVEGGDKRKILEKLNSLLNTTLEVKIITFDKDKNNLIFSEKAAGDKIKEDTISGLKVGSQIKGAVSGIIDFGIFVRFNDIEGLVHISEVAWEKIEDLNKLFKIGDQVDAEIISISGNKVSLSLKRLKPDLWAKSAGKYKQDQVIEGPITRVVPYGVFVKLNPQIEALAHISDLEGVMPEKRGLSELFEIDKKYTFKILKIDKEQHKIALKWVPDKKSK